MSKGIAPGTSHAFLANANFAAGSMNFLMSHADETRSIPGRSRVTHVLFRNSDAFTPRDEAGREGTLLAESLLERTMSSAFPRNAQLKKSIAAICSKRW